MDTNKRKKKTPPTAAEMMDKWYGGDQEWDAMVAEEELKLSVGQLVYDLRTEAKLSQAELAKLTETSQSIISRVENANYEGSALEIMHRVCVALRKPIKISKQEQQVALAC